MRPQRTIRLILKEQAKEAYEKLCKVVEEQKKSGRINSEEMQLLKSINSKIELLKFNPIYGQSMFLLQGAHDKIVC